MHQGRNPSAIGCSKLRQQLGFKPELCSKTSEQLIEKGWVDKYLPNLFMFYPYTSKRNDIQPEKEETCNFTLRLDQIIIRSDIYCQTIKVGWQKNKL
jgi:hypothetical protein